MELRRLRYFVAVAEELHFGRAASKLNIAQPALSLQIQTLEKEIGVQLLVRSTRRVALTKAGETFYQQAEKILTSVEKSCAITRAVAGMELNKLSIGTIYPATFSVLPSFLSKISRKFPDVEIHIQSDTTDNIIRDLERGTLNLAFIRPFEKIGSLRYSTITQERYLLAVAKNNQLANEKSIMLEDLRSQKIISFLRSHLTITERYFFEEFKKANLLDSITYTCNDILSLISLVAADVGVGFVPEWVANLPNRNFNLIKVKDVDFKVGMGIAWSKEDPSANLEDIVDIAKNLAKT